MDAMMDRIANILCSKPTFIVFCIIAFLPLCYKLPNSILDWQQWVSQTAIQLIALNVLGYNSNKGNRELMNYIEKMYSMEKGEVQIMNDIEEKLNHGR